MLRWYSQQETSQRADAPPFPPRIDFYTAADGRRLAVRIWEAAQPPRARVVFLHGITSHGGWYSHCAQHLAGAGFQVHFLDRRGSGLNADRPGDIDHWQTWIDDVVEYIRKSFHEAPEMGQAHFALPAPQNEPVRGVVLCGMSWGGKLAVAVARRHPRLVHGVALICPGLYSPFQPGLVKRLALALPMPAWLRERRLKIPLRRPELFTDSQLWREFIDQDPLALREVTRQFAREDQQLTSYARQAAPHLHMPLLLMLAGRDRIVNNRRTREFFARVSSAKKSLNEYSHAAHTLEFEPDPLPYFADLADWVSRTTSA